MRSLTRLRELSLLAGLPAQNHHPLFERLWAAEASGVGDSREGSVRGDPMSHEPGADDDASAPASRPAVHVDEPAGSELGIDLIERRNELVVCRHGKVADGHRHMPGGRRYEVVVGSELAVLREIEEESYARRRQVTHLDRSILRTPRAGMTAGDQPARFDDGRRAHDATVCPSLPTSSEGTDLIRPGIGADSSIVARLRTPTDELRDRALVLATELGVDSGTWYVRVLEEGRSAGAEADLGALVRVYWELQRVTGRADLRDEWRRLADALWSGETASIGPR